MAPPMKQAITDLLRKFKLMKKKKEEQFGFTREHAVTGQQPEERRRPSLSSAKTGEREGIGAILPRSSDVSCFGSFRGGGSGSSSLLKGSSLSNPFSTDSPWDSGFHHGEGSTSLAPGRTFATNKQGGSNQMQGKTPNNRYNKDNILKPKRFVPGSTKGANKGKKNKGEVEEEKDDQEGEVEEQKDDQEGKVTGKEGKGKVTGKEGKGKEKVTGKEGGGKGDKK